MFCCTSGDNLLEPPHTDDEVNSILLKNNKAVIWISSRFSWCDPKRNATSNYGKVLNIRHGTYM